MASTQSAVRGLMMVPMSLKPTISVQECDDWYCNEHVPIRMRLPYFEHGYRYRSIENGFGDPDASELPEWLALYDIANMWKLTQNEYVRLLQPTFQSLRESKIIQNISASRRYYDLVSTYEAPGFVSPEDSLRMGDVGEAYGATLIVVGVSLSSDTPESESEWNRWYEEDYLPALWSVPGWRRTRRYRTSFIEDAPTESMKFASRIEYLTLNEFANPAVIGGPEHQIAIQTESRTNVVASKWRHAYKLHYIQGPASRHLAALGRVDIEDFVSPDGLTKTLSGPTPRIESYIIARDDMIITYMLEGTAVEPATTLVLSTSAGLSWKSWNGFVERLLSQDAAWTCQILRLQLPIRRNNADNTLNDAVSLVSVANDLEDCFNALRMGKAAFHLNLRLGGRTADGSRLTVVNEIGNNCVAKSEPLAQLCGRNAIITCDSSQRLTNAMDILERAASVARELDDLWDKMINPLQ
ncbi:uncharacterized protein A1O5_11319 [Cladophialophora psammophila CBS 110553]|uniref:Uncharacterized protein n=1 Tax=Cladophialophora psammophila CBS 110553 TaxID=1182543 RepID=W9W6H3_9EURO|nr:uncharacterized protein A1O5_11319 [Cladophialophora psammophila CBS 110553]EXJ63558.1 hypothetical protein A1O5_11319 [Cladophialophora psammophila CBS 110553]